MQEKNATIWQPDTIYFYPESLDASVIADIIYRKTCRSDFTAPGFCVVNVGNTVGSVAFRRLMVDLKEEMATIHEAEKNQTLIYISAGRFDQQESTKLHLDGGPDESLLMLGYEPSQIDSELEIADYSKCAFELGISPQEFMEKYNPMFQWGADILKPYVTPIPCFSKGSFQIVCINNSSMPYSIDDAHWQGILHTARIIDPDESKRRIINSTMIATVNLNSSDIISKERVQHFIHTTELKRRGYDKTHLEDHI